MLILRELIFGEIPFKHYDRMLDIFIQMTGDKNFKIVAATYKGVFRLLSDFPEEIQKHGAFENILKNICSKLGQHDIDKAVKKSVMKCAGCVFERYFTRIKDNMQNEFLAAVDEKLKIEIEKGYILSQLTHLPIIFQVQKSQVNKLVDILKKVIESLGSTNFDLNLYAVESTKRIIEILKNNLDKAIVSDVMQKTKALLADSNLPSYVNILMAKFPAEFKPYV